MHFYASLFRTTLVLPGVLAASLLFAGCDSSDDDEDLVDIPTLASGNADLETLVTALTEAGLVDDLQAAGPFTVFAPTDAAFAAGVQVPEIIADANSAILSKVLLYHVVAGEFEAAELTNGQELTTLQGAKLKVTKNASGVFINGAKVSAPDVAASNGVVHVIDGVLMESLNVVERAIITPGLDTLVDLVVSAGLADDLSAAGPFTVFAPTDAAFAQLAAVPTGDALVNVLLYHVVSGEIFAANVPNGNATTLNGATVALTNTTSGVTVRGRSNTTAANVAIANVDVSNGVVHVIDRVLLP